MCGNPQFPEFAVDTVAQATSTPSLNGGSCFLGAISGENNDFVAIVFDRKMNPFKLLDPANYTITGPVALNLSTGRFLFDGQNTVTIGLANYTGHNLDTGSAYTITVNNVWSAQGVKRSSTDTAAGIIALGDLAAPSVLVTDVRIDPSTANALLVTASEALDTTNAENPALYDYAGGNIATTATRVGPRCVSLTFAVAPVVGQNLQFTLTDLAGNTSGVITRAVTAADTTPPLVAGVAGLSVPNFGRDTVSISFNEQVNPIAALAPFNYTITSGAVTVNTNMARPSYESATNTVTWTLPSGVELDATAGVTVTVQNVLDFSGNIMPSPVTLSVAVTGDSTPPAFVNSFVDVRDDPTGKTVDVLFSEDVDPVFAGNASNWTVSGGPSVSSVTLLEPNHARLVLSSAIGAAATVGITSVPDLAKNASGSLSIDPVE
jgi:hypothetical protein